MFTLLSGLGTTAGKAIKVGLAEYKRLGGNTTPGALAVVILKETSSWRPTYNDKPIMTAGLRSQLVQALAGLAYNIGAAEAGKGLV